MDDQDRTFKANFSEEGLAKLKDTINEKLNEFLGEYADDTLVEYVIVLLRNGRRKDDTAKELQVFLGDDNLPFISWLWDHLSSKIELYLSQPEPEANLQEGLQDETEKGQTENGTEKKGRKRQKIVWEEEKEIVEERGREKQKFPLRSVVSSVLGSVQHGDNYNDNKKSGNGKKARYQQNDTQQIQRTSRVDPPRRLLQFAVRDAVKPVPATPKAENVPVLKRLRSVLASSGEQEEVEETTQRTRSVITVPAGNRMETSSSFDRAEKTEASSSVFDRLGRAKGNMGTSRDDVEMDSNSDHEGYGYSVKQENGTEKKSVHENTAANKPSKILNISVNVNTWKPAGTSVETQRHQFSVQNTNLRLPTGTNGTPKSDNQTQVRIPANTQGELSKAVPTPVPYKAAQPLEDPETRTLFVSNVHFGATKDALTRHFNKFGAVLKVIILIDPSTGQPTGSAYVEFLQKESAEAALSINGTSFMSRILKVVRKDSSEANQVPGWPRIGSFPTRPPLRRPAILRGSATRNLKWNRGAPTSGTSQAVPVPVQSFGAVPTRSFTYTRASEKSDGN